MIRSDSGCSNGTSLISFVDFPKTSMARPPGLRPARFDDTGGGTNLDPYPNSWALFGEKNIWLIFGLKLSNWFFGGPWTCLNVGTVIQFLVLWPFIWKRLMIHLFAFDKINVFLSHIHEDAGPLGGWKNIWKWDMVWKRVHEHQVFWSADDI